MKTMLGSSALALTLMSAAPALAQDAQDTVPPPPVEEYTPPPPPQVRPQGEWIYTDAYGWIWVPTDTSSVVVQDRPYAYFYTPTYGWTWYVSPWGLGFYRRGPWVHAVVAPHVYYHHAWIVHPHARYTYRPAVIYHPGVVHHGGPVHRGPVVRPHHRR